MKNKYENNLLMFRIFVKIKTKEKIMKKVYYCYSIDSQTSVKNKHKKNEID